MNDVPRLQGREPGSLVRCPRCRGSGRVGPNDAACVVCWCSGRIEYWRWQQLMDDEARRSGHVRYAGRAARRGDGGGESADADSASEEPARGGVARPACRRCGLTDRCPQCPFGPFVLVA